MRNIAELNMLLRVRVELPAGLKLATEEFREGWNFLRTGDARRLGEKVQACGWSFIKFADGLLKSGVGETSQEATAGALKLALRHVSTYFNAVEVQHIELTQYPWFFLARVRVYPYRIQQGAVLPVSDEAPTLPITPPQRRLPPQAAELYPHFGSDISQLKEMLVLARTSQARSQ
jgi:hypothetical protein